jgi:protein phosphatase
MITCPECGFASNDGAKFCDRCGQGLTKASAPPPLLPPLKPGTVMEGGLEVVSLLSAGSVENRYRVTRSLEGKKQSFQLRERIAPAAEAAQEPPTNDEAISKPAAAPSEDPNGPRAKTRELKPIAQAEPQPTPASVPAAPSGEPAAETAANAAADAKPEGESQPAPLLLTDMAVENGHDGQAAEQEPQKAEPASPPVEEAAPAQPACDLGDVFGRVLALSQTIAHPAFSRALSGFARDGRVYLLYPDEALTPLSRRPGGIRMSEAEAIGFAIQVCQAVATLHRRGLRVNDICPDSAVFAADGRVKLTGLDYVSNDNELQAEPIVNDGYTAPEIYRAKRVDKRADVFSVGALLYSCLTGERIAAESWREEAGAVSFYPPHVVWPALEKIVRRALAFNPEDRWPTVDALKAELIKAGSVIRVRAAALTDVGRVRELNEDSVMALEYTRQSLVEPAQSFLYVVADGMGGAAAGEIASAIAVKTVRDYVESRISTEESKDPGRLLQDALEEANRKILEYQAANPELRGMGSTAVSTLILPPEATVAWVGDSRVYLSEGSSLRQLTKDHSLVQRLIELGQLTPEQARTHEHKNVITRSLGARQSGPAGAEATALKLKRGDRMVLCSDGLTTHVEDHQIGEILRRHSDPEQAARELVVAANAGGGTDNVSVVVIFAE